MSISIRALLLIVALLAGSIALACGDSGGDSDEADQPSANEDVDGGDEGENGGDEPSGDAASELGDLAGEFRAEEFKIVYASSTGTGEEGQGTITIYWKPPDNWRMDISSGDGDVTMLNVDGTAYFCSSEGGVSQCLESPIAQDLPLPFLSVFTDPDGLNELIDTSFTGVDVDRSDRTIAGESANCYSIAGTIEGETGSAEYCFGDNGVLLLLSAGSDEEGEFRLEATSVEDSVSDSDLEPPYEVTEFPDIGDIPGLDDLP